MAVKKVTENESVISETSQAPKNPKSSFRVNTSHLTRKQVKLCPHLLMKQSLEIFVGKELR